MIIGIIKEGKIPPDKRVPLVPQQCVTLQNQFPELQIQVQNSNIRAIPSSEYEKEGLEMLDDISNADVLMGVKEVNIEDLIANKTYFFFSHTIKKQDYNRNLLQAIIEKNIRLIDYECLRNQKGTRLVGFGRYAGIVGAYNAFLAYGKRTSTFSLKPANQCQDRSELISELDKVKLPANYKIIITGLGRVAGGAEEILKALKIEKVNSSSFLTGNFENPVYAQLTVEDYFRKKDNSDFDRFEVYKNPDSFFSDFMKYARTSDMFIPCHYWDSNGPGFFTKEEAKDPDFQIRTIADISCDIDDPIASTIRPSTIADPIYEYDRMQMKEVDDASEDTITVMAVDNLPCELPKDASEDFGSELVQNVLPHLLNGDQEKIIENATIAMDGKLMPNYAYLQAYLEGEE